jgi:Leucine-rich repeat (LRR) protein
MCKTFSTSTSLVAHDCYSTAISKYGYKHFKHLLSTIALLLLLVPFGHAQVVITASSSFGPPPPMLSTYAMTAVPEPREINTSINSIASPIGGGGTIRLSRNSTVQTAANLNWSSTLPRISSKFYATGDNDPITLTMPDNTKAFDLHIVVSNMFGNFAIKAVAQDGSTTTQNVAIPTSISTTYIGFHMPENSCGTIKTITITPGLGVERYIFGQMAISRGLTIPDANFAAAIRQYCPSCINECNYLLPPATRLQRLEVGEKNVISLEGIEGFTSLRELYSENNKLTELPINLPVTLKTVYVNGNQLASLPNNLPNNIQFLNVQGNKLTALPASLPSNLQHLYVYDNQLTSLPENLPIGLSELHCYNNQLRRLPSNLPNGLRLLYTEKNPMTCLPAKLPKLAILRIDRNRIACIPHAINMVLDANFETIDLPICSTPCSPSPNRIQVRAFVGKSNNNVNELSWQVQNPTPNAGFEVEYSQNGQDFETIGTLTAAGETATYQFMDKAPQSKLSFYRLKINELGVSEAAFSPIIKIQTSQILRGVTIYPNPVSDILMIENEAGQNVEIINTVGQVVVKTKTNDVQTSINVTHLQTGVYFVRMGDKQFKVLKQ